MTRSILYSWFYVRGANSQRNQGVNLQWGETIINPVIRPQPHKIRSNLQPCLIVRYLCVILLHSSSFICRVDLLPYDLITQLFRILSVAYDSKGKHTLSGNYCEVCLTRIFVAFQLVRYVKPFVYLIKS